MTIEPEATIMMYFPMAISMPSTATHFNGDLESPVFFKCTQIGVAGDHWWAYYDGCWRFIGHSAPHFMKPLSLHKSGPMQIEVCQHSVDITNKPGIACPEGCLSNAQRGKENRQLAQELADLKSMVCVLETEVKEAICDLIDMECFDTFICEMLREKIMDPEFRPLETEEDPDETQ